ncbi:MAG: ABC transporter substrate-binding protein, partial [Acidobacteriota bacterium]|nr:ABC transporter substrate-binding protein [Acidobacteriota bacterium]
MNDETNDRISRNMIETGGISRRKVLRIGAGGAAGFAVLGPMARGGAFAQSTPLPTPKSGGTLVVGLQSEPSDNIDPAVTPWAVSHNIMMHVYDTLVWQDPADGSFKPGLADSWTAAPDGLSYTFKLKSGVTFHDGTVFDAAAVKWNFDRIADPATKSGFAANLLGPYASSQVVDPQTVTVTFKTAYAPFLDSASQAFLGMVSPAAVKKYGADYGVKAAVGTGPFMFKEWVRADHLSLVKNPNYNWAGGVFLHNGPAYLDGITFRFIQEDATRSGTLQSGETQVIELVPTSDIQTLKDSGFQIVPGKAPGIPTIVEINTAKAPTDDIAVRKAINLGTDQKTII